jgi:CRP/FNR family transcriptional regulator
VRRVSLFYALQCGDLSELRALGKVRELKADEPLFHQGDEANLVYTVAAGSLRLYRLLFDGRRQITGFALPGEFLGISIDDSHDVTAEALEPCRIWCFPRARFDDFVSANPILKDSLLEVARQELAAAQQQFIVLGRKTAMERVASFLLYLYARFERITGHPMDHVALPMSRADIADYLGLTKETVSRVFGQLRNSRIMRLETLTCIQVLDRHALKALADGEDA